MASERTGSTVSSLPSTDTTAVWRLAADEPLRWRAWDGDHAVFDPATGQTHLLDVLAAETLKVLQVGPASPAELVQRLASAMNLPPNQSLIDLVDSLIARFDALGLIEPGPP